MAKRRGQGHTVTEKQGQDSKCVFLSPVSMTFPLMHTGGGGCLTKGGEAEPLLG